MNQAITIITIIGSIVGLAISISTIISTRNKSVKDFENKRKKP